MKKIFKALPGAARDAAGLAGAGLIAYGAWLVSRPAGLIIAGIFLLIAAVLDALSRAERD